MWNISLTVFFVEPRAKLDQLRELDMVHLRQLMKSSDNTEEIEELLTSYNEMVQTISSNIEYLDMITTSEEEPAAAKTGE